MKPVKRIKIEKNEKDTYLKNDISIGIESFASNIAKMTEPRIINEDINKVPTRNINDIVPLKKPSHKEFLRTATDNISITKAPTILLSWAKKEIVLKWLNLKVYLIKPLNNLKILFKNK